MTLGALNGATTAGALGVVLLAAFWPVAQRLLDRKIVQWLGTVSFNLYLIHEPIVIGVAFAFGAGFEIIAVLLSIPIPLIVAYGFYRIIELPSQRIARRIQI